MTLTRSAGTTNADSLDWNSLNTLSGNRTLFVCMYGATHFEKLRTFLFFFQIALNLGPKKFKGRYILDKVNPL